MKSPRGKITLLHILRQIVTCKEFSLLRDKGDQIYRALKNLEYMKTLKKL